jgi:ribonuclease BN (tRNA processing enzyme)
MNKLKFLGTAGGRVLVFRQLRASGGLWYDIDGSKVIVDPGPGSLIRCYQHNLDPQELDAVILTHKHLDHSADVNVIIEAISEGGFKPKGVLLAPGDCYDHDPVILNYNREYLNDFLRITQGYKFKINDLTIEFPKKHKHGPETYGYKIYNNDLTLSHIVDTQYFEELSQIYEGSDILIMNMVFAEPRPYPHLCYDDVLKLAAEIKPELAIVTHFGYKLWEQGVEKFAKNIQEQTGIRTVAADDGMEVGLDRNNIEILKKG